MTFVYKKTDFNYMSNATKFYFKKVRTKRTRLEQDQTNYIQQKKVKQGPTGLAKKNIRGCGGSYYPSA